MRTLHKLAFRLSIGLAIFLGLLLWYPVRTGYTRNALIIFPCILVLCLVIALWKHKRLRWLPLIPHAALVVFLILPGRRMEPAPLRAAYLESLMRYEGTRYVWGGEGFRGVDCSGLLRAAMVDACVRESVRTFNPALARRALDIWYHDASAGNLGDEVGGLTSRVGPALPLRDAADAREAGDFAITADGSHALAYVGGGAWVEADPYVMKVIELKPG
ncbi:MAG TPA: NlpC/P60 family protein, partial [Phycisphaerae bacterium]|nr:NlpC/P60 family protein [Phycisphaerae bacterium]